MIPYTKGAYKLLHDASLTLATVEANGIRIDMEYLDRTIQRTKRKIEHFQKIQAETDVMKAWRKRFRSNFNPNSNDQLGKILFETLGFTCHEFTATKRYKTDEKTLGTVDSPFVQDYLKIKKLEKTLSTYLIGLKKEVSEDGRVHPSFNLNTVKTFRSSSSNPNFQNIPIRDTETKKLVRKAFIASPGCRIVESDYSGIEVRIAACYHKDPNMLSYIKDPTKDMHRDMAMKCYKLKRSEVTKSIRFWGKSGFVFPQFYGDWYIDCTRSLWDAISRERLETVAGKPLKKHLAEQGIHTLGDLNPKEPPRAGTFEAHIKQVERDFWEKRFPVYNKWKKDWYDLYKSRAWLLTLTGFICQGYMKRNEVINYPVQGPAFHCLLWSIIRLVQEIKRRKMKTKVIGQIHDSIVSDVPDEEFDEYKEITHEIMVNQLVRAWKWIIVPLEIETEASPVDGCWADKEEV
jgi:DNA polymerase-1